MSQWVRSLLGPQADPVAAGATLGRIASADATEAVSLLETLGEDTELLAKSDPAILAALALAAQRLFTTEQRALESLEPPLIARIVSAYPPQAGNRHRLMYLLARQRSEQSLGVLAKLLAERPPQQWDEVGQVLSPLMQQSDWKPKDFFPAALDALVHRSVASPLLDLANYLFRESRVDEHPAAVRCEVLATLLGGVADRLGKFEEDPRTFGDSVEEVQEVLSEAVAIAVSLCDALGLIGWEGAISQLYKALDLKHRRVQSEAAGALARLDVKAGRQRLIALAAEPSARLRVLAYADELGFGDAIDGEFRTEIAHSEAELALWLSQPGQMGVPPTSVEVIDSRLQYWPSFERPIDCFLVRYAYQFGDRLYSNVGITGPIVHAMGADLANLPIEDIYAVYAGWQAEHPEIFRITADQWNSAQQRLATPLTDNLDRQGFESIKPIALGFFLDEHALIAEATRDETTCVVVTDGLETIDFATAGRSRPLGGDELWYLFLGRKLLRTFNA